MKRKRLTLVNEADHQIVQCDPVAGNPNLVRILFHDGETVMLLIRDWLDLKLKANQRLSCVEMQVVQQRSYVAKALLMAYRYICHQPKTSAQVQKYLKNKQVDGDIIVSVIQVLESEKLVNDELYASLYIQAKQYTQSRRMMAWKLNLRGIESHLIQQGLKHFSDKTIEFELAVQSAEKYLRRKGAVVEYKDRMKLAAFLERKGFSRETIYQMLERIRNQV